MDENNKTEPIKKAKKSGSSNGLRLEIFTGDQKIQQQFSYKSGIRVVVVNREETYINKF